MAKSDGPQVTKYKVTCANGGIDPATGENVRFVVEDYPLPEHLDAYVADARTRWQYVGVSEEPDAGPAGYEGDTVVPEQLLDESGNVRDPAWFGQFGDASTPENALDDLLIARGESPSYEQLGPVGRFTGGSAGGGGGGGRLAPLFGTMLARVGFLLTFAVTVLWVVGLVRLAFQTTAMKNALADQYATLCTHAALYSTVPGASAGTELTGGSPAYARKVLAWGASAAGVKSATAVTFDVASGSTVAGGGLHSAITAGTYYDGASLTSQNFASQGTYQLTPTVTVT